MTNDQLTSAGFILNEAGLPAKPWDLLRDARDRKDGLRIAIGETAQRLDRVEEKLRIDMGWIAQRIAGDLEYMDKHQEPAGLHYQILADVQTGQAVRKELVERLASMVGLWKHLQEEA